MDKNTGGLVLAIAGGIILAGIGIGILPTLVSGFGIALIVFGGIGLIAGIVALFSWMFSSIKERYRKQRDKKHKEIIEAILTERKQRPNLINLSLLDEDRELLKKSQEAYLETNIHKQGWLELYRKELDDFKKEVDAHYQSQDWTEVQAVEDNVLEWSPEGINIVREALGLKPISTQKEVVKPNAIVLDNSNKNYKEIDLRHQRLIEEFRDELVDLKPQLDAHYQSQDWTEAQAVEDNVLGWDQEKIDILKEALKSESTQKEAEEEQVQKEEDKFSWIEQHEFKQR